jgi:LacI family transcriptional regulator
LAKIRDVAQLAGVSPMTVSRALNRPETVSPDTRARVLHAVRELGYVPNGVARSLSQGRTNVIALVLADIQNLFFTTLSRGVEDVAQRYGYTLMVGNTDEQPEKERQYLDIFLSRQVDGVILSTAGAEHLDRLQSRGIPLVLIDRMLPDLQADSVMIDVYEGGRQLIAHLLEQGYRDIMFIGGPERNPTLESRLAGCRDAMRAAGLTLSVRLGRFDQGSGEEIAASLRAGGRLPEALVAANNLVAVGAVVDLRRHGLSVPEDVALACFGEIELASLLDPFLTVVREPAYDAGRHAMELLFERLSGADGPRRHEVLPVELVVRRSTRRLERVPA